MEDIRIMRQSQGNCGSKTVGTTPVLLVPGDDLRVAVMITYPISGRLTVSDNPNVTDQDGMLLASNGGQILLDLQHHGGIVKKALYGVLNTGSAIIGIMVSHLDKE